MLGHLLEYQRDVRQHATLRMVLRWLRHTGHRCHLRQQHRGKAPRNEPVQRRAAACSAERVRELVVDALGRESQQLRRQQLSCRKRLAFDLEGQSRGEAP